MTLSSQPNSSLRCERGRYVYNQKLLQIARTLMPTIVALTLSHSCARTRDDGLLRGSNAHGNVQDACTNPSCFQAKVDAHIAATVAAKPKLVQISTAHNRPQEGSPVLPRNKYVAIQEEKPKDKQLAQRPEYKTCRFTTEAIIAEGSGKGTTHKVCANPDCSVHHPQKQTSGEDAKWKAEQEKERREAAIANTTSIRIFEAITEAAPVRLMKRDLLFIAERPISLMDENRLAGVAREHGIKKAKDNDSIGKLFAVYLRRTEESILGSVLVQLTLIMAASRSKMERPSFVMRPRSTRWTPMPSP